MHTFIGWRSLALSFAAATIVVSGASTSRAAQADTAKAKRTPPKHTVLAPADQYFGPNKMSVVGMHTALVNLGERYHAREISDTDIVHDAGIVEAALYRWHDKYPKDMGAIATAFRLEQLYQVVQSTNARSHATAVLKFIAKAAPASPQAHLSRLRLAEGFPPLTAETATHATPNPYVQEASASSAPIPAASALPNASDAMASATPAPAVAPAVAPSPAAPTAAHT